MTATEEKKNDKKQDETKVLRMDNADLFKSLFRSIEARDMVARVLSKITGLDEEVLLNADYIGGEHPKKRNMKEQRQVM